MNCYENAEWNDSALHIYTGVNIKIYSHSIQAKWFRRLRMPFFGRILYIYMAVYVAIISNRWRNYAMAFSEFNSWKCCVSAKNLRMLILMAKVNWLTSPQSLCVFLCLIRCQSVYLHDFIFYYYYNKIYLTFSICIGKRDMKRSVQAICDFSLPQRKYSRTSGLNVKRYLNSSF